MARIKVEVSGSQIATEDVARLPQVGEEKRPRSTRAEMFSKRVDKLNALVKRLAREVVSWEPASLVAAQVDPLNLAAHSKDACDALLELSRVADRLVQAGSPIRSSAKRKFLAGLEPGQVVRLKPELEAELRVAYPDRTEDWAGAVEVVEVIGSRAKLKLGGNLDLLVTPSDIVI